MISFSKLSVTITVRFSKRRRTSLIEVIAFSGETKFRFVSKPLPGKIDRVMAQNLWKAAADGQSIQDLFTGEYLPAARLLKTPTWIDPRIRSGKIG